MISWASVFLAFRMSMVSFNSVSSESLRKHQYVVMLVNGLVTEPKIFCTDDCGMPLSFH